MILFRADGNSKIGSGHIMRCLSIADMFIEYGEECIFVLADKTMISTLQKRGYKCEVLNTSYMDTIEEIGQLRKLIEKYTPKCLFVDSYFVTKEYFLNLNRMCKIAYLDDWGTLSFPVDYLINYNVYGDMIDYNYLYHDMLIMPEKFLLGAKFAPLRKEFANVTTKEVKENIKDILVSTGGADPSHVALGLIKYICDNQVEYQYHFVIGAMNKDIQEIKRISENNAQIVLHENVSDMKALMSMCDIAVSAAGSTLYELCACGTPTVTYVFADNQIQGATSFEESGLMINVGDVRVVKEYCQVTISELEKLAHDYKLRLAISKDMRDVVDGKGAKRIVDEIQQTFL